MADPPRHPFGQPVTQAIVGALHADSLHIEGDDAHHLLKSLRLRAGASFVATDGAGTVALLEVLATDRHGLEARVRERVAVPRPRLRLWLVAGAEAARSDWLIEKAAELGAWAFVPLHPPGAGRRERWERLARAALKQSLGAWLLRFPDPEEVLLPAPARAEAGPDPGGGFAGLWLADPGGALPEAQVLAPEGDWLLVAGPPAGFREAERAAWLGRPGAVRVGLGPLRLRAETAALALLVGARLRGGQEQETA